MTPECSPGGLPAPLSSLCTVGAENLLATPHFHVQEKLHSISRSMLVFIFCQFYQDAFFRNLFFRERVSVGWG